MQSQSRSLYRVRSDFSATPHLSYVIGVMLGDGSAFEYPSKTGLKRVVALDVMDRDFAQAFARELSTIVGRNVKVFGPDKRARFTVWINRKDLYEYFRDGNVERFKGVVERHPRDFLRGFADSEGGVHLGKSLRESSIDLANNDPFLLDYVKRILDRFGIKSFIRKSDRNCFRLVIKRQESILRYAKSIGFSIRRKEEALKTLGIKAQERLDHRRARTQLKRETLKLHKKGLSSRKIQAVLGVPNRTVCEWVNNPEGCVI